MNLSVKKTDRMGRLIKLAVKWTFMNTWTVFNLTSGSIFAFILCSWLSLKTFFVLFTLKFLIFFFYKTQRRNSISRGFPRNFLSPSQQLFHSWLSGSSCFEPTILYIDDINQFPVLWEGDIFYCGEIKIATQLRINKDLASANIEYFNCFGFGCEMNCVFIIGRHYDEFPVYWLLWFTNWSPVLDFFIWVFT